MITVAYIVDNSLVFVNGNTASETLEKIAEVKGDTLDLSKGEVKEETLVL